MDSDSIDDQHYGDIDVYDNIKNEFPNANQLSKDEIVEKMVDPIEKDNFKFFVNKKARSPIWDRFYVIFYNGIEQNYAKCRYCDTIFENDSSRVTKQLHRHECENMLASIDLNTEEYEENVNTVSKSELQDVLNDPERRSLITLISKDPAKCAVWEHLDLVYYKDVQQNFAACKHCNALVQYSSKVGTASIRKHVLKCTNIPSNGSNLGNGSIDFSDNEEDNDALEMLIPEVVYDGVGALGDENDIPIVDQPSLNNTIIIDADDYGEANEDNQNDENLYDKFQLMEWYEDPKERIYFSFEKPKHNDDAEYWKTFEYVVYKNVRQKYCRCTQCGVYINFVSTRRRGLARHMKSCNKRLPLQYQSNTITPQKELKFAVNKKIQNQQLNQSVQEVKPIISKPLSRHSVGIIPNNNNNITCATPQLAAALTTTTKLESNQIHILSPLLSPTSKPCGNKKDRNLPIELRNQIVLQQLSLVTNDMYPLEFLESENFRELAQVFINIGADHGPHRIDDIITTKETLVKYWIPTKVSKIKKIFREILFNENYLNFSVDLYENKLYKNLNFKYILTVTCHILREDFTMKTMSLGTREFDCDVTSDDILKAFLKVVGDYYETNNLSEKCCVVTKNNEILNKAFENYICLPSLTDNLREIFNDLLLSDDLASEITENVRKIVELFTYLRMNYSYHLNSSESYMDQIEEFYEMYEIIKKLLKDKKDHHRLTNISRHTMKTVINFLEFIKLCIETFKTKNQSSITGVLLWRKKLLEHYQPTLHEHKLTAELKKKTTEILENKFDVTSDYYKLGLFLNPNFKSLKFLNEEDRVRVHQLATKLIENLNKPNVSDDIKPMAKKMKIDYGDDIFAEYTDKNIQFSGNNKINQSIVSSDTVVAEINKYSNDTRISSQAGDDIMEFWARCKIFPNLKKLSKLILSIPTSSYGIDETALLNANRSYREVYSTSQSQSLLNIEEFHSVLFLNRNYDFLNDLEQ